MSKQGRDCGQFYVGFLGRRMFDRVRKAERRKRGERQKLHYILFSIV